MPAAVEGKKKNRTPRAAAVITPPLKQKKKFKKTQPRALQVIKVKPVPGDKQLASHLLHYIVGTSKHSKAGPDLKQVSSSKKNAVWSALKLKGQPRMLKKVPALSVLVRACGLAKAPVPRPSAAPVKLGKPYFHAYWNCYVGVYVVNA